VGVASEEHGVLGYTGPVDGLGTPALAVNAGASLGLNDSEAGTWIEELYGSGWSLSTGVDVGLTTEAGVLAGSMVAPGVTIAKLGRAESAGIAAESDSPVRRERMKVDCNMLQIDLIYREVTERNDQRTERMANSDKQRRNFAKMVKR
jgi:hypothetical protein